jgi:hypothetical protein
MSRIVKPKFCKVCHTEFRQYKSTDKYCSFACQSKDAKPKKQTLQALKTIDAMKMFLRNKHALKLEQIEKKGHNYCEVCNEKNPFFLDAHHIVFRSERPKHPNLNDQVNILLVCRDCHNQFHEIKEKRNYLLEERNLKSIFNLK